MFEDVWTAATLDAACRLAKEENARNFPPKFENPMEEPLALVELPSNGFLEIVCDYHRGCFGDLLRVPRNKDVQALANARDITWGEAFGLVREMLDNIPIDDHQVMARTSGQVQVSIPSTKATHL